MDPAFSRHPDFLAERIVVILKGLTEGILRGAGSGNRVGAILSWLERESLSPAEVMTIMQRLRENGYLGKFLNLVSHRDLRRYLRDKQVPWDFILQNWEPDVDDSLTLFAGFLVGAGENAALAIQLLEAIIGAPFSPDLARKRQEFWEGLKVFFTSPVLAIQEGAAQVYQEFQESIWKLEFFEAGRILGNVTLLLLTLPTVVRSLPGLARRAARFAAQAARVTLHQLQGLGVSLAKLREFALQPVPLLATSEGFVFMEAAEDVVVADRVGRAMGKISKTTILNETKDVAAMTAALRGLDRLSAPVRQWLVSRGLWGKAAVSLRNAGNDIIDAINTFHTVDGFHQVVASYLSANPYAQKGARFVMRYALAKMSDKVGKVAMRFEMPVKEGERILDIFAGVRYELKSVREVRAGIVRGSGQTFGQLVRDILQLIDYRMGPGGMRQLDLTRLRQMRWVFDSKATTLTRTEVVKTLQEQLAKKSLLKDWKPGLKEVQEAIAEMVEFWP